MANMNENIRFAELKENTMYGNGNNLTQAKASEAISQALASGMEQ